LLIEWKVQLQADFFSWALRLKAKKRRQQSVVVIFIPAG